MRESRFSSRVTFTPERSEGGKAHETRISFPNMYRIELFDTTCGKFDFYHTLFAKRVGNRTSRTECGKRIMLDANFLRLFCNTFINK